MLSKMRLMCIIDDFLEIASASKSCAPTHVQYLHVKVFSRNGHKEFAISSATYVHLDLQA